MNAGPETLVRRILLIQVGTHLASFLLSAAFAPRVLLLEPESSSASLAVIGLRVISDPRALPLHVHVS